MSEHLSETGKFAACVLGMLRTAADSASQDEQGIESSMSRLAFALQKPALLTEFCKFSPTDQRRVMTEIDLALGTIPLACGCSLPRL
jgi:hypothetical protein